MFFRFACYLSPNSANMERDALPPVVPATGDPAMAPPGDQPGAGLEDTIIPAGRSGALEPAPADPEARAHAAAAAEPAQRPSKVKPPPRAMPVNYADPALDQFYTRRSVVMAIEKVDFDLDASQGQVRVLDMDEVTKRKEQFMLNPPDAQLHALVWEKAAGGPYLALTMQHRIKAMQSLRLERLGKQAILEWMLSVTVDVLASRTPIDVPKIAAGKFQGIQQLVYRVSLSRSAQILPDYHLEQPNTNTLYKIAMMVIRSGHRSVLTTMCHFQVTFGKDISKVNGSKM